MALLMALLMWLTTAVIIYGFAFGNFPMPELISQYGGIDSQFGRTMFVVGVAFFLSHAALGWYIFKYGRNQKVTYSHGNTKVEIFFTVITAVVFIVTAFLGQKVWADLHLTQSPANAVVIEVTGQQFGWNFRYPGPDNTFGKTDPKLINDQDNQVGIDPNDPAGKDDFVKVGKIVVPKDTPVKLILRSKDVTHNFFVPNLRIKQDTVPGLQVPIHFVANKVGEYEVACSELCGLGHYKMVAKFTVVEKANFETFLQKKGID